MVSSIDWQGTQVYTMENDRLHVALCPEIGNNLIRVYDRTIGREVLRVPPNPETLREVPTQYGTPVLMPPSRIERGTFFFRGREYRLNINHPSGCHIHGLLKAVPWKVIGTNVSKKVQSITSELQTADFPEILEQYPHDLLFKMTCTLDDATITQRFAVTNRGGEAAPLGFGLHTWFMLDGKPEQWRLKLPVSGMWEMDENLFPSGRLLPLDKLSGLTGSGGLNLLGTNFDTVFRIGERPATATLVHERDGYEIRYSASDTFQNWVIYTKGEADQWICLEPLTWVPNAPNLPLSPEVSGLLAVEPGQTLELEVTLAIAEAGTPAP